MKWWKGSQEICMSSIQLIWLGILKMQPFLNSQNPSGLPEHMLKLKIDTVCNFAQKYGHLCWVLQWNKILGQND